MSQNVQLKTGGGNQLMTPNGVMVIFWEKSKKKAF